MIFGFVTVEDNTVVTHRDTYQLSLLSVVSVRRPYLAPALLLALAFMLFTLTFSDLLYRVEIISLLGGCVFSLIIGIWIGKLTFVSRDLRGSELASVIYGSYRHLNHKRREIVRALNQSAKEKQV